MPAKLLIRPPSGRVSEGATTLRRELGDDVCRLSRTDSIPRQYKAVLNWGNSGHFSFREGVTVWNKPEAIRRAIDKLESFNVWTSCGVRVPACATDRESLDRSHMWVARTVLNGSSGDGIVIIRPTDAEVVEAPLYTQYIKKQYEYRVHVAFGKVLFAQAKKRVSDAEQTADQKLIRNYDNGWVFCPVDLGDLPKDIDDAAVDAVNGLGLDFGAIDLVIGNADGLPYVLECNTAPGLSSPGLIEAYTNKFLSKLTE